MSNELILEYQKTGDKKLEDQLGDLKMENSSELHNKLVIDEEKHQ